MKKLIVLLMMLTATVCVDAQPRKNSTRTTAEQRVLGKHMLSLQWISWDYFGSCNITKQPDGTLKCTGEQLSKENSDYLRINGTVEIVDADHLKFTGTIATRIYHINNGEECLREGTFDFVTKSGRKYWRLQQMDNPCDNACDYVDIYFKR